MSRRSSLFRADKQSPSPAAAATRTGRRRVHSAGLAGSTSAYSGACALHLARAFGLGESRARAVTLRPMAYPAAARDATSGCFSLAPRLISEG